MSYPLDRLLAKESADRTETLRRLRDLATVRQPMGGPRVVNLAAGHVANDVSAAKACRLPEPLLRPEKTASTIGS